MKKINILAVSISLALGLSACNPSSDSGATAAPEVVNKAMMISGIDLTAIDQNVRAQDDFFRHVNGAWLTHTEIPADKSRYGLFNVLYDNTQDNLKTLIQESADIQAENGSNAQKLGDMYRSYMNVELANEKGLSPIQSLLDGISDAKNMQQLSCVRPAWA